MLEVGQDRTGLGTLVVCRDCKHHVEVAETLYVWIDSNGDVYYQGADKESLAAFVFHHG